MVTITLYAKQKKRHRCTEQTFGLCGRRWGWDVSREQHVYYLWWNINSPGWMHETSARAWCTGKTQRDWMEREVGGGIGMGNTCNSMADSCQCMTKPTECCEVISLQLIKINEKKKKDFVLLTQGTWVQSLVKEVPHALQPKNKRPLEATG